MSVENQFLIALAIIAVVLLAGGSLFARWLSHASPRTIRTVWPMVALTTFAIFGVFVYVARMNVKG